MMIRILRAEPVPISSPEDERQQAGPLSTGPWVPRGDMGFSVYPSRLPFSVFCPSSCSVNSPYAASATEQLSRWACQPCRKTCDEEFRGTHALSSITPPAARTRFLRSSSSLPQALPRSGSGQGRGRQRGPVSREGVHVARRPAGGTGGDRCHGGPDLFLQEECEELIVSLPRSDVSMALPRHVGRRPQLVHVK